MKGLKEGLAAVSAAVVMAGPANALAQEATKIIPDPHVREVTCRVLADNRTQSWKNDLMAGCPSVSPMGCAWTEKIDMPEWTPDVRSSMYAECMAEATPPEPTPAEKRQAKCAEVGAQMHDYMLKLLDAAAQVLLPESRRSPSAHALGHALDGNASIFADDAAIVGENQCLAAEEKAARAKCDEAGKNGTDPAYSMMMDHLNGFGGVRKGEKSPYDITSACLAEEGLKP